MEKYLGNLVDAYERTQLDKIEKWKNLEPSVVGKVLSKITQPVGWIINKIIPQSALRGAIEGCNGMSKFTIDIDGFKNDNNINRIKDLKKSTLEECDKLADSVHNWAIAIATVEGGATGAAGLPGLAVFTSNYNFSISDYK